MKRLLSLISSIVLLLTCLGGCSSLPKEMPEDLSFSLTWGCYGISSYDSRTGKLVKTKDATHPEEYITNYKLSDEEMAAVYEYIRDLDPDSYPDEYNPYGKGVTSDPSVTLILTVRTGESVKTIRAEDIAIFTPRRFVMPKGKRFVATCNAIIGILTGSEEWKALPDYEFYYD